ncbi:MAG: DoxX family protein [Lentisphaerae bacterium]|nr:DoxX family protein [Lentisphaerota bacterium]
MKGSLDVGIFVLRLGIGIIFAIHGYPKLSGGPGKWEGLGQTMGMIGITFLPVFWGFMAAVSEFAGGICLAAGAFSRIASGLMAFTMLIATVMHLNSGHGFQGAAHAMSMLVVFIALLISGPGRLALGSAFRNPWLR